MKMLLVITYGILTGVISALYGIDFREDFIFYAFVNFPAIIFLSLFLYFRRN